MFFTFFGVIGKAARLPERSVGVIWSQPPAPTPSGVNQMSSRAHLSGGSPAFQARSSSTARPCPTPMHMKASA